jgi:branched-chain amino acid transport system ATP-binding protein
MSRICAIMRRRKEVTMVVQGLPLLEVHDIGKRFGGVIALDEVSFDVAESQIFGVIGSNGAGKSTLLSVVSGAFRPTVGTVALAGATISGTGSANVARQGIARAHQIPRPFRQMTVRQHADLAARLRFKRRGARHVHVDAVLHRCGLESRANHVARDLGLLDLKRLEVARAVAMAPKVLLLDEVAAGLVGREVDQIIELIRSINAEGTTIVVVEHVQALIRELAERVLVLEWGRVLVEGPPDDVANDARVIEAYLGRTGSRDTVVREVSASRPAPVLVVRGLDVSYGPQPAVRDCTIEIASGEVVAVVGANGAGKTSLARAIAGMIPSRAGRVELGGEDLTRVPSHVRARRGIALCHEGRRLFAEQTVEDNLRIAGRHARHGSRALDERVAEVMMLFPELTDLRDRRAGTLSGGQQQMVSIGRGLVLDPRVVIFDELSLGLAPMLVDRLFQAIPALRERGLAVLLIEQNVAQAMTVADHVYVLDHGAVAFSGSPAAVFNDQRLRAAYLGASTRTPPPSERNTR